MTEEEYRRLRNLLDTVVEQQATFAENQAKAEERMTRAEARMTRHEAAIAALLTIAETHEREMAESRERMESLSAETNAKIAALAEKTAKTTAETDERLNALISVVERIVSKNQ